MNLPTKHESNRKKGTSKDFCKLWCSFFIIFQDLCPTLINSSLVMNFGWLSYAIPQFWKRGFSQRGSRAYYSKAGLFSVGEWRDSIWEIYHTAITWFKAVLGGIPVLSNCSPVVVAVNIRRPKCSWWHLEGSLIKPPFGEWPRRERSL